MSGEPSAKRPCTDENKNATMSQQQLAEAQQSVLQAYMQSLQSGQVGGAQSQNFAMAGQQAMMNPQAMQYMMQNPGQVAAFSQVSSQNSHLGSIAPTAISQLSTAASNGNQNSQQPEQSQNSLAVLTSPSQGQFRVNPMASQAAFGAPAMASQQAFAVAPMASQQAFAVPQMNMQPFFGMGGGVPQFAMMGAGNGAGLLVPFPFVVPNPGNGGNAAGNKQPVGAENAAAAGAGVDEGLAPAAERAAGPAVEEPNADVGGAGANGDQEPVVQENGVANAAVAVDVAAVQPAQHAAQAAVEPAPLNGNAQGDNAIAAANNANGAGDQPNNARVVAGNGEGNAPAVAAVPPPAAGHGNANLANNDFMNAFLEQPAAEAPAAPNNDANAVLAEPHVAAQPEAAAQQNIGNGNDAPPPPAQPDAEDRRNNENEQAANVIAAINGADGGEAAANNAAAAAANGAPGQAPANAANGENPVADRQVGRRAVEAALAAGATRFNLANYNHNVEGRPHPLLPPFVPCPPLIARARMTQDELRPGRWGQLNLPYAVAINRAFTPDIIAMLGRHDCWWQHGRNSIRCIKNAEFVQDNGGRLPRTNMTQSMLEYKNLCAQLYATAAFNLPIDGRQGIYRLDFQETTAIRKLLSLRVRGRNVDTRITDRANVGLAKIPPQVRNNVTYDSPNHEVLERIARWYESQDINENGAGA